MAIEFLPETQHSDNGDDDANCGKDCSCDRDCLQSYLLSPRELTATLE